MHLNELTAYLDSIGEASVSYKRDLMLSSVSTFKIGGKADMGVYPKDKETFCKVLSFMKEKGIRYTVIGNASNVLFSDEGYRGVIVFTSKMAKIRIVEECVFAEAGATLAQISARVLEAGLGGLEFAYGIPGSFGGAVFMNAGAYGGCIEDVLGYAEVYDVNAEKTRRIHASEMKLGYRHSICMDEELIVLSAALTLKKADREDIKSLMDEFSAKRKEKQPLEFPSAGSVFKRPDGYFAGKLIEDAGLKGYTVGGAQVSEKHAGFIINRGGATSCDVINLIEHIKDTVRKRFGVELDCEIRYIG
ncbi:MAG: UDP-N-acetylmuramate dehydrogenase [Ruminococcaceae bacterium]|nr:UDP-N-acetylmuramate dehydrogenase [Oscillospiraceae bacterium]